MDEKIIATFCLCDDLLKAIKHPESAFPQQLNDAEVMTIALVAASCFQGRHDPARFMLMQHGYIPGWISKSRLNRRLHRLKDTVAIAFDFLAQMWKTLDTDGIYVIDSFPVSVCDNIRIRRAKLYQDETHRGYQASKRRYSMKRFGKQPHHWLPAVNGRTGKTASRPTTDARVLLAYREWPAPRVIVRLVRIHHRAGRRRNS